jgi:phage-related protein
MTADAVASLSKQMTAATYDFASFHNLADADVYTKLRSGVMGEAEGLKSLGIILNESTLKQSMLNMGIQGTFTALDEETKIRVRWNAIMAQSADAQGDVTRTAGSYTNSLKGIKGLWSDFLADAGAKFTPVLTGLFNTIMEAWPKIEPALMGLVDMLADGLSTAVPIIVELGGTLLPILTDAIGVVFKVLQPIIPIFGSLANTLLPPLMSYIGMLASTILPPFVNILDVLNTSVLQPLMPVFMQIVGAFLPVLGSLLEMVTPLLQAVAPIIQFVGNVLGVVAEVLGKIIGWVIDGVKPIADFFGSLFGGAKSASGEMSKLADNTNAAAAANERYGASSDGMGTPPPSSLPYDWPDNPGGDYPIPGNAGGTNNWRGGMTRINEKGGELAYLPSGTKIIPADKSDKIISNSRSSKQSIFAPNIQISMDGDSSSEKIQRLKEELRALIREEYERMQEQEAKEDALQEALI